VYSDEKQDKYPIQLSSNHEPNFLVAQDMKKPAVAKRILIFVAGHKVRNTPSKANYHLRIVVSELEVKKRKER
jgi:hypothetical protein